MIQNDVQAVTRGSPTMLHCPAIGDPPFRTFWTKDGVELPTNGDHFVVFKNGTLAIYDALVRENNENSNNDSVGLLKH